MGPQGLGELTRFSWNAQFDKKRNTQVALFSKKLAHCQVITNFMKMSNS
jgi:hypothetical protein